MTTPKINTQNNQDKQKKTKNPRGIIQETTDKQEQIKETLDNSSIVDTMEFLIPNQGFIDVIKNDLAKQDCRVLKNAKIICFELKVQEHDQPGDFKGIDLALDKLIQNPESPIILTSFMPLNSKHLESKKNKIDLLLSKPNVKFINLPFLPSDLIELFEPKKSEEKINENYLATITANMGIEREDNFFDLMKESLKKINLKNLQNCIFIDVFAKYKEGQYLQSMEGLSVAIEELQKDPSKKIILTTPMGNMESLKALANQVSKTDKLNFLLGKKNVKFFEYGDDIKKLETIFDESEQSGDQDDTNTEVAFQKIMESEISHFLHDSWYWINEEERKNVIYEDRLKYIFFQPQEKKNEKRIAFEDRLISILQMQHPSFKLLPRENNLQWIIDMYKYSRAQVLPEGTRFEGVFVDRDGTLYDNKNLKFNQKIIDMIKEYEKQGKKIIIRSGGNLEMKQKLLDEAGLDYKIQNKSDYKGGTVEITIDNDSEEFLLANAKIKTEKHIKV